MSLVINQPFNKTARNIYFIYNFNQVYDQVLLVMYNNESNAWQKIPVDYSNGSWKTNILSDYTDYESFYYICDKLKIIFDQHKQTSEQAKYTFPLSPDHAVMILGGCS